MSCSRHIDTLTLANKLPECVLYSMLVRGMPSYHLVRDVIFDEVVQDAVKILALLLARSHSIEWLPSDFAQCRCKCGKLIVTYIRYPNLLYKA